MFPPGTLPLAALFLNRGNFVGFTFLLSTLAMCGAAFFSLFIGWAVYPPGCMTMPGNLRAGPGRWINVDVVYNLGDAVNKIGFGLMGWNLARSGAAGLRLRP